MLMNLDALAPLYSILSRAVWREALCQGSAVAGVPQHNRWAPWQWAGVPQRDASTSFMGGLAFLTLTVSMLPAASVLHMLSWFVCFLCCSLVVCTSKSLWGITESILKLCLVIFIYCICLLQCLIQCQNHISCPPVLTTRLLLKTTCGHLSGPALTDRHAACFNTRFKRW